MRMNYFVICILFLLGINTLKASEKLETDFSLKTIIENTGYWSEYAIPDKIRLDSEKNLWVLSFWLEVLFQFDQNGKLLHKIKLEHGIGSGTCFKQGSFDINGNKIAILDDMNKRVSLIDTSGNYLTSFSTQFSNTEEAFDIAFLNQNEILVLGKKNAMLFHLYNLEGKLLRSFGAQIEKHPQVMPTSMSVVREKIYVVSSGSYEVYCYKGEEKEKVFEGNKEVYYEIHKEPEGKNNSAGISFPANTNGIVSDNGLLYVSLYNTYQKQFFLEIISIEKRELILSIHLESWASIGAIDEDGQLYLLRNNGIELLTLE